MKADADFLKLCSFDIRTRTKLHLRTHTFIFKQAIKQALRAKIIGEEKTETLTSCDTDWPTHKGNRIQNNQKFQFFPMKNLNFEVNPDPPSYCNASNHNDLNKVGAQRRRRRKKR